MFKDYAICTREELEEKRKRLACLQDNLKYPPPDGGGSMQMQQEINRLQIEIWESEWAIDAKEAGTVPYIRYRIDRVFRHAVVRLYGMYLAVASFIEHVKLWFRIWRM